MNTWEQPPFWENSPSRHQPAPRAHRRKMYRRGLVWLETEIKTAENEVADSIHTDMKGRRARARAELDSLLVERLRIRKILRMSNEVTE